MLCLSNLLVFTSVFTTNVYYSYAPSSGLPNWLLHWWRYAPSITSFILIVQGVAQLVARGTQYFYEISDRVTQGWPKCVTTGSLQSTTLSALVLSFWALKKHSISLTMTCCSTNYHYTQETLHPSHLKKI